jgi:hypothetical protein
MLRCNSFARPKIFGVVRLCNGPPPGPSRSMPEGCPQLKNTIGGGEIVGWIGRFVFMNTSHSPPPFTVFEWGRYGRGSIPLPQPRHFLNDLSFVPLQRPFSLSGWKQLEAKRSYIAPICVSISLMHRTAYQSREEAEIENNAAETDNE